MDQQEEQYKSFASQLRKPTGDDGKLVGKKMNQGNALINRRTIEHLDLKGTATVLEIGMGNGFFVPEIFERYPDANYIGCDFSMDMVRESELLNEKNLGSGKARFTLATANQLPFSNSFFDKVFTINTLYFWEDYESVLTEIKRVLKPGGELIISIRPKHQMKNYPFVKYGFTMFSKEEVSELLKANGFSVSRILEETEPEQEINGRKVSVEMLIVFATSF